MSDTRLFKFLDRGGVGCFSGRVWSLPEGGVPGAWMRSVGAIDPCRDGVHVCRAEDLAHWAAGELYEAEIAGAVCDAPDSVIAERARLVREVADWIADHGDTAASRGEEGLRRSLALSDKRDPRPLTALELLRASGVVLGTFEDGDLRALRRLESGEDGVIVDPEKRRRDLLRLYGFVSWVNAGECRKALLADYFGVARAPVPCGACDVCGSPRLVAASVATADDRDAAPSAPTGVARGDWIEIAGRGVYLVMKAESRGRRLTVTVEDPETLAVESFDLSRRRWSKLS